MPIPTGGWAAEAAGTATTAPRTNIAAVVDTARTAADQRRRGRVNMTDSFDDSRDNGRRSTATQRDVVTTLR